MRILYAIQGTGNGHLSRAKEFIPHLSRYSELDLLVSGSSSEVDLGHAVRWKLPGIGYRFGKRGGIDYIGTLRKLRPIRFLKDVQMFPVEDYDLVINDFEPVTAWGARRTGVPCIGLSHQAAFLSANSPRPNRRNPAAEAVFQYFSPCSRPVGFHYQPYDHFIHPPVIRREVRALNPVLTDQVTVYLPAWSDRMLESIFVKFPSMEWHLYSKHCRAPRRYRNVQVLPVDNRSYLKSLERSRGLITAAGFESPAEALYLGKQLLVVPMKGQYEQACNAEALRRLGVDIVNRIDKTFLERIESWLSGPRTIGLVFPDQGEALIEEILRQAGQPRQTAMVG